MQPHQDDAVDHSRKAREVGIQLPYHSASLSALLNIFAQWGSGGFIAAMSARSGQDLDPTTVVALTVLARQGATRPSALARHLRIGASAVSKISNRLAELGLAERTEDEIDARATRLVLTEEGAGVVASLVASGDGMMALILADWTDTDRDALAVLLQRFERDVMRHANTINHPSTQNEE